MKYILMMNTMEAGDVGLTKWPKKDREAHLVYRKNLNSAKGAARTARPPRNCFAPHSVLRVFLKRELAASGELVVVEGLALPDQAKNVRAAPDGGPSTDGVFPESKEFLAGYWMVDVETPEPACAIAARASAAPGPGGTLLNMPIEVRQVMMTVRPGQLV